MLAVAGAQARVIAGVTGPVLAREALECLALEEGTPQVDSAGLVRQLAEAHLPGGPVLVLAPEGSGLPERIRQVVARPVVALTACSDQEGGLFHL